MPTARYTFIFQLLSVTYLHIQLLTCYIFIYATAFCYFCIQMLSNMSFYTQVIQLLSDIGGALGLWVAASLFTILEIVDVLIQLLFDLFLWCRYRSSRSNKVGNSSGETNDDLVSDVNSKDKSSRLQKLSLASWFTARKNLNKPIVPLISPKKSRAESFARLNSATDSDRSPTSQTHFKRHSKTKAKEGNKIPWYP